MALSAKTLSLLANALGSLAAAKELDAAITADATLTYKQLRTLEAALADKKAAADVAAAIDASSGTLSDRSQKAIRVMMITKAAADELIAAIQA